MNVFKVIGVVTTVGVAATVGFASTIILTAYVTIKLKNVFDNCVEGVIEDVLSDKKTPTTVNITKNDIPPYIQPTTLTNSTSTFSESKENK